MPFELFLSPALAFIPYCILGLLAMAEGPLATLMGGAAAFNGLLLPVPAYLSIVVGNLTADMGWYSLGRYSKMDWLAWISRRFGVDSKQIVRLEKSIQKHAPRLLFLAKFTVGFPIPTLVATGLSRVPVSRWIGTLVLGELIKSAALVSVGYIYAQAVQQTSVSVQWILWVVTAIVVVTIVIWLKLHKRNSAIERPGLELN